MRLLLVLLVAAACAAPSATPTASPAPTSSPGQPATPTPAPATASPSPVPTTASTSSPATAELIEIGRIRLPGAGPIDVEIDGERAWVAMADSGQVVEVDLTARSALRTIDIGGAPGHLELTPDRVYAGGGAATVAAIDRTTGAIDNWQVGPIEGLAVDGDYLWALQKSGQVVKLDGSDGRVLGRAAITIDADAHANVVAGGGSAWASGDRTAVSRLGGDPLAVTAEIETGGGIPFGFADGLVYGARQDTLWSIDPAVDTLAPDIELSGLIEILALEVDGDTAWIAARQPGRVGVVVRLNLDTGDSSEAGGISLPAGIAIGTDAVWVTSYETNELVGYSRE